MNLFRHCGWLFPAMLLATALQNYHDLSSLMSEGNLSLFKYEGPAIYKLMKDVVYILLFVSIIFHAFNIRRVPFNQSSIYFVVLVSIMLVFSTIENGALVGLIGLRWIFPFMLFLLMRDWIRLIDVKSALHWVILGLVTCLALQAYQIFFMPPVFGEILPGISARTPGLFVAPNSAAFFACASAACVMVFVPYKQKLKLFAVILALVISSLAQSGTGMVTSVLLAFHLICGRQHVKFWFITLCGLALALPNLDFLTMRANYVELSGGGRVDAFVTIFDESALSVTRFGLYTNAANLLSPNPDDQLAPDSLIASWVGNFGLFTTLAILLFALLVRDGMRTVDWTRAMPCVLVFGVFSLTTVVFEAFPMNLYLALGIWSARRYLHKTV